MKRSACCEEQPALPPSATVPDSGSGTEWRYGAGMSGTTIELTIVPANEASWDDLQTVCLARVATEPDASALDTRCSPGRVGHWLASRNWPSGFALTPTVGTPSRT
jgi:hypothetical protein